MRCNSSANKSFIDKSSPKTIDTIRFNNRYIDKETVKEKATGIVSVVVFTGLIAFSFFQFL
ncbi:hypothetical protein [Butyrivibrio sp. AC2005]|uniref:hypothetical protein n=1 Tax=Butyrivibrio sp. AC2005 TaxID=1280672 RepID=UPI0004796FFC|nr:hypothetical protein [Butyrivibrio sp. AC2005]